jgi:hypothetical protein
MDHVLLEEGRRRGTLTCFYDEETRTVDYSKAASELEACLVPHGTIPRERLLLWYHGRGRESRFLEHDVREFLASATQGGRQLIKVEKMECPDAPNTVMYEGIVRHIRQEEKACAG